MGKTVRELAEEIGVSKQRIMYQIKKIDDKNYQKKGNKIYINENGVNMIKRAMNLKNTETKQQNKSTNKSTENDYIHTLKSQLSKKDEQLEQTQKLLDQQQQLNAEDKKIIHDLRAQLALEEPKAEKTCDTPEEQEEKLRLIDEKNRYKDEFEQMKRAWEKSESDNVAVIEQNTELRKMLEEAEKKPKKWYQFWK